MPEEGPWKVNKGQLTDRLELESVRGSGPSSLIRDLTSLVLCYSLGLISLSSTRTELLPAGGGVQSLFGAAELTCRTLFTCHRH